MSFNNQPVSQEDFERGKRALERFRKMIGTRYLPLLRAVTKNPKLVVEAHSNQCLTDGKIVRLPIPLALGDETLKHNRDFCGQRDPKTLSMLCGMCAVEDEVDGNIFHESAHITERSFDTMSASTLIKTVQEAYAVELSKLDDDDRKALQSELNKLGGESAMKAASVIDTWLPMAFNVVEDVYVNRRLWKYRQGVELPMTINARKTMEQGIEDAMSGTNLKWEDQPESAQALLSALMYGEGQPHLSKHLKPECDLTGEAGTTAIMDKIPSEGSIQDRLRIALELLTHLRTLGFCPPKARDKMVPPPPPPQAPPKATPPPPSEDEADDDESEEDDGSGEESEQESEANEAGESDDGEPGDGEAGDSEGESDGSEDSDEDADEAGGEAQCDEDEDGDEDGEAGDGQADDDADESDEAQSEGSAGDEADDEDSESSDEDGEAGDGEASESSDEDSESSDEGGSDQASEGDGEDADTSSDSQSYDGDDEEAGTSPPEDKPSDWDIDQQVEQAEKLIEFLMGHGSDGKGDGQNSVDEAAILEQVIAQEGFDHPSGYIYAVQDVSPEDTILGNPSAQHVEAPRHLLTPALTQLRVVFAQNRKTGMERSLKRGSRLDTAHLYRAGTDDPRIFGKRNVPKTRDWFVCVGIDFSGSAYSNGAGYAQKVAGHAIGELLHQLGIDFAMYGHDSGSVEDAYGNNRMSVRHREFKAPGANWKNGKCEAALDAAGPFGYNLDGHSMEQYRKVLEKSKAQNKLLMYFTDGAMPNHNFDEELALLKENLEIMKRQQVQVVGVGYRTDSPSQYGLETIVYDSPEDIASIVEGLKKHLVA